MTDLQLPTVNGMREGEGEGVRGKEGCYNITILYHDIVPGVWSVVVPVGLS